MLLLLSLHSATALSSLNTPLSLRAPPTPRLPAPTLKTTESDVEEAVEVAERLWAKALEAREKADELAERAASLAERAQENAAQATESMEGGGKLSLSMLGDAQIAMTGSLDAGSLLSEAVDAAEAAEALEAEAEEALKASERAIERYDSDFPDADAAY